QDALLPLWAALPSVTDHLRPHPGPARLGIFVVPLRVLLQRRTSQRRGASVAHLVCNVVLLALRQVFRVVLVMYQHWHGPPKVSACIGYIQTWNTVLVHSQAVPNGLPAVNTVVVGLTEPQSLSKELLNDGNGTTVLTNARLVPAGRVRHAGDGRRPARPKKLNFLSLELPCDLSGRLTGALVRLPTPTV